MPVVIKTTFNFAGLEQGWSEDFYWQMSSSTILDAMAFVNGVAIKRAALLATGYSLTVIRNMLWRKANNTKPKRITDLFEPRYYGVNQWGPAAPNYALMCEWSDFTGEFKKKQFMRGIPAGLGDSGKKPNTAYSNWLSAFNSWKASMIGIGAGWLYTTVDDGDRAVIDNYQANTESGLVTFNLKAPGLTWPLGLGLQQRVYIALPGKTPLDGNYLVVPKSNLIAVTAKPVGVHPDTGDQIGTMKIRKPNLVQLAIGLPGQPQSQAGDIEPQRIVTHKTGRPSYASRGRVLARAKW